MAVLWHLGKAEGGESGEVSMGLISEDLENLRSLHLTLSTQDGRYVACHHRPRQCPEQTELISHSTGVRMYPSPALPSPGRPNQPILWVPEMMPVCPAAVANGFNDSPSWLFMVQDSAQLLETFLMGEAGRLQPPAHPEPLGSHGASLPTVRNELGPFWDSKAPPSEMGYFQGILGMSSTPSRAPVRLLQVPRPAGQLRAAQISSRGLAKEQGHLERAGPGRILGRARERLGDCAPEIPTIGQSVLNRFRSSEVKKKKSENIV